MHQQIAPIAVRPLALSGISERMEVSLYENDYGGSVRTLNAVRRDLAALDAILKRNEAARSDQPLPNEDPSATTGMPSLSVEELAAQIANGGGVQIVDARAREHMSLNVDLMAGATWRDPDRVEEWIAELTPDKPVAIYCSYGFDVGCNVTKTLIERGFDARFIRGGVAAWYASGGARALRPDAGSDMAQR